MSNMHGTNAEFFDVADLHYVKLDEKRLVEHTVFTASVNLTHVGEGSLCVRGYGDEEDLDLVSDVI